MKKIIQFLEMPIINVVLTPLVVYSVFYISTEIGLCASLSIALAIYIFLTGILFSKIKDKRIKAASAVTTAVLFIIVGIIMAIWTDNNSDTGFWAGLIANPLPTLLQSFIFERTPALSYVFLVLVSPLPVLISVGSSTVFTTDKNRLKAVGAIAIVAIMGSAIAYCGYSIYGVYHDEYSYVGEDGQLYNAYYDMNGVKYEDHRDIPYYDKDGNIYYWTYDESIDSEESFLYCGELTDSDGNKYDINKVYVGSDGYIFIDKNDTITYRDDLDDDVMTDWCHCDKDGNNYASILGISYLSDGTPFTAMGDEYK
ncbi:MAG: glycosyltransferase family 87 protein [Eubacterium sp.]